MQSSHRDEILSVHDTNLDEHACISRGALDDI